MIYFLTIKIIKRFHYKGSVSFKAELIDDLNLEKINFNFFGDKNDVIIKNICGNIGDADIWRDIKLNLENGIN